jgi:hypothetical protein
MSMTDFQTLARTELAEDPPPARDVVSAALRAGRRGRRRLWALRTGAVALVLAIAAVALPSLVPWQAWRLSSQARSIRVVPASGPMVPATPGGALEALRYLLPPGQSGAYQGEWLTDREILVRQQYSTGNGGGLVALNVTNVDRTAVSLASTDECRGSGIFAASCVRTTLTDGSVLTIQHMTTNCEEATVVSVLRPADTTVTLFLSDCDGRPVPLTDAQAVAIAVNPVFAWRMPASLVDAGARDFPDLPGAPR